MSILGIDYGAKKIGLARSDEANKFALPLDILINVGKKDILEKLKEIIKTHDVSEIVVGVPISLKAEKRETFWRQKDLQNKQMKEVLEFVSWLKKNVDLPIEIEDERLSTKMANGMMKEMVKKGPDDAVAAMLILQTYLDKLK